MKKLSWLLAAAAVCLFVAPLAYAADDCCWDWSPKEGGKDDREPDDPQKEDPFNLETPWAVCVKTGTRDPDTGDPGNGSLCFARNGRQMVWPDWECIVDGTPAPDSTIPPFDPNTATFVGGFYCQEKAGPGGGPQFKDGPVTDQPEGPGSGGGIQEGKPPAANVPTLSTTGMVIMMILLVVAAGWMLRRKGAAPTPAA